VRYVLDCSVAVRWFVPQTHWQVAARVFQQFRDDEVNFYDARYLALAEREDLQVLTADGSMTRAFAKLDLTLHLADYPVS